MLAVVIPYFQRASGLLTRALLSVANQRQDAIVIYVVDDGSPSPAEADLKLLPSGFPHPIKLLKQKNSGPGQARNLGLQSLGHEVDTVAFLDSDDGWRNGHLTNARLALGAGADFYFADHQREDEPDTRFTQCGYKPEGAAVSRRRGLYWCNPQSVFRAIVRRSPVGTSTVVVRRSLIGETRFSQELRSAGEDSIFWLDLLTQGPRTACGVFSEVAYGKGVNVFSHGSWGDAKSLRTTLDEMLGQHVLRSRFALEPEIEVLSHEQSRRLDLSFCSNLLACGRRMKWDAAPPALAYLRRRPLALTRLPEALVRAVRGRAPRA